MSSSSSPTAELLKVLADETRLHVVRELMRGPQRVYELNSGLGIDQSLLSHHLRVLREAGLATCKRDGKAMLYRLSDSVHSCHERSWLDVGVCRIQFDMVSDRKAGPDTVPQGSIPQGSIPQNSGPPGSVLQGIGQDGSLVEVREERVESRSHNEQPSSSATA